jgi:NADP-dependent 3-hydroxy acid dehydrogenase YdfG
LFFFFFGQKQELQELKNSYAQNLLVIQGNVAKDEDNKLAVDSAIKSFGSIDGKCIVT